jgi:uncharacterized membrane protein
MAEAFVVNLFLTVRVLIVGAILLALPRVTRKGLLFGAYVGEELVDTDPARQLQRSWDRGCLAVMAIALLVGWSISLAGWPLAGNLTGTAVLLLAALALYVRTYSRARELAPPAASRQAQRSAASLDARAPIGERFAQLALGICVFVALATLAYAAAGYYAMPDSVPTLSSSFGRIGLVDRSLISALWFPSLNLVVSPFFALLALFTATAKHSLRGGSGGRSLEAQDAFRALNARLLSWMALLICASLTLISVQVIRVRLAEAGEVGPAGWWLSGALLLFFLGFAVTNLVRLMKGYGQGGALLERGSVETPLTGTLADNTHWVWGLFYVNSDDPSMMVEKRFGMGYSFNYGNRNALAITVTELTLLLALAVVGVIAVTS